MICDDRHKSVLHFAQWRREEWPDRNLSESEGGKTGAPVGTAGTGVGERWKGFIVDDEVDKMELVESLLSVLDWRDLRRKGMIGWRYWGKTEGNESEFLRRKAIVSVSACTESGRPVLDASTIAVRNHSYTGSGSGDGM
jgi:hypothetical protein